MVDEVSPISQDSNSNVAAPSSDASTVTSPVTIPEPAPVQEAPREKLIPQSKVNEIVGREKLAERERITAEMRTKLLGEQKPSFDVDAYKQIAREEVKKELEYSNIMQSNQLAAKKLYDRIDAAKAKYSDFDKVTKILNIDNMPVNYAHIFNEFDNPGEILYELGKNPEKLGTITALSYDQNLTKAVLSKISESIKTNESALKEIKAKPPLSQTQPSVTGIDNGTMTVDDLRKDPKYRF